MPVENNLAMALDRSTGYGYANECCPIYKKRAHLGEGLFGGPRMVSGHGACCGFC